MKHQELKENVDIILQNACSCILREDIDEIEFSLCENSILLSLEYLKAQKQYKKEIE